MSPISSHCTDSSDPVDLDNLALLDPPNHDAFRPRIGVTRNAQVVLEQPVNVLLKRTKLVRPRDQVPVRCVGSFKSFVRRCIEEMEQVCLASPGPR